jgi:hypothetical protein
LHVWFCSLTTSDLGHPVSVAKSDFSSASDGLNYKIMDIEDNNNKNNKEQQRTKTTTAISEKCVLKNEAECKHTHTHTHLLTEAQCMRNVKLAIVEKSWIRLRACKKSLTETPGKHSSSQMLKTAVVQRNAS